MEKVGGMKFHPCICSCRAASRYKDRGWGLFFLPPSGLLGTFALSWVTSSMISWLRRLSGYVLQRNFCSGRSSQLRTCKSKPQRPEFSSNVTSVCSWLGNSIGRAVAACLAGMTVSCKATSALQEDTQRGTQLTIRSQQAAKTSRRNAAVVVDASCFLPSLQLLRTPAGFPSSHKLPRRFPEH